ncbi:MAG: DUF167 domain-containing protein [Nanoarchaeota archaeon]|nr:DUF167 domain-containing protein [Nanoarchaeota archaeon]
MKIKVRVKPNSGKQEIVKTEEGYSIYLKSVPEKNRANIELIKMLEKHFKKNARIKSGLTSKNKIIEIEE